MLLIEDRLDAARSHLAAGRADNAALLFESVLDVSPANITALRELASIKLRTGDVKKAQALAGEAALRAANDPDVLTLLAKTALVSDEDERANAALDQALAVDAFHPEACRLKAVMLARESNSRDAELLLQDALERHPDSTDLLAALSELYMENGLAAPALEFSQKALDLSPDKPELLALVGSQLAQLGDHEKAIPFLERGHLLDPGNALFLIKLTDSQAALGQLSAAHRTAKRIVDLFPNLLAGWASYTKVMTYRGEAQASFVEFVAVARQHPEKVTALLTLGAAYRIAGNATQALRFVEPLARQLETLKPAQKSSLMALMRDCCLSLGMFDQVATTFQGFDARAVLGLPSEPTTSEEAQPATAADAEPAHELATAFADTGLFVDGALSTLEAVVLLRFRGRGTASGHVTEIHGPSALTQVVALMEDTSFTATDIPQVRGSVQDKRTFPLSHVLALPATVRGEIADRLPYMHASQARREIWRGSLADFPRPLVALAWDSSRPGILLEDYRPVLGRFEGTLVSVIWDESRSQLRSWPQVIDAGVHFNSLDDLAAVIAETDAILGPDGVPLHVAGAMSRPGALLSFPSPPWYWYDEQGKSVWYPSISVIRSTAFGNWEQKLPELGESIDAFLGAVGRADTLPPAGGLHLRHYRPPRGASRMASWRPQTREPDAIRATIYDYLRNRAPKVFLEGGSATRPLGRADMIMSNGRTLAVDLRVTPVEVQTFGTRSAIVFDVAGHAAEASTGYEIQGRIVLDRETLAFLSIEANPAIVNTRR